MVEQFLKALLGKDVKLGAAGICDSSIAAALFAAMREAKLSKNGEKGQSNMKTDLKDSRRKYP